MKHFNTLSAIFLALTTVVSAQSLQSEFATNIGGQLEDECTGIAVDANGNFYVVGNFNGEVEIDGDSHISAGDEDFLLAKFNADGEAQWSLSAGSSGSDAVMDIAVDGDGDVYITGAFRQSITLGSETLTSAGGDDFFVAKISSNGSVSWAISGGGSADDAALGLAVNGNGEVYLTGYVEGVDATFDTHLMAAVGGKDAFYAKVGANGSVEWANTIGTLDDELGNGIAVGANGKVYLTGSMNSDLTIGSINLNSSTGMRFVAEFSASGTVNWAEVLPALFEDGQVGLTADASGNVYVAGSFSGSADFGNDVSLAANGGNDAFAVKLNSNGDAQWAVKAGGSSDDMGVGVAIRSNGDVLLAGSFRGNAKFGSATHASAGADDNFVLVIGANGNVRGYITSGGAGSDIPCGISAGSDGSVYVAGTFEGTGTYKTATTTLTSNGDDDMYVWKLESAGTGIEEITDNRVKIHPNPATDLIYLTDANDAAIQADVRIYDIRGQLVSSLHSHQLNQPIAVNDLEEGTYLLMVSGKGETNSYRFIKQ